MACGIPTIATEWSAQKDFINEETGYPIRVKEIVPASSGHIHYDFFNWAEPDFDHRVDLMRYVYENRDAAKERSQKIATEIISRWTWDHMAEKILSRLAQM